MKSVRALLIGGTLAACLSFGSSIASAGTPDAWKSETRSTLLERTGAVVEGVVSDISFAYDERSGPRTVVKLEVDNVLLGETTGTTQTVVLQMLGGPLPDGRFLGVSETSKFVAGDRFVVCLMEGPWFANPFWGTFALRVDSVDGTEVLSSTEGTILTDMTEAGLSFSESTYFETIGKSYPSNFSHPAALAEATKIGGDGALNRQDMASRLAIMFSATQRPLSLSRFDPEPTPFTDTWRAWPAVRADSAGVGVTPLPPTNSSPVPVPTSSVGIPNGARQP